MALENSVMPAKAGIPATQAAITGGTVMRTFIFECAVAVAAFGASVSPALAMGPEFELSSLLAANGGDGSAGFVLRGVKQFDFSGSSVSGGGDINGDGFADLIVGAPSAGPSEQGHSYVVLGKAGGFGAELAFSSLFAVHGGDGSQGTVLFGVGIAQNEHSGGSVSSAGDVNGDGLGDLIIGAAGVNAVRGESYVVFGSASGFGAQFNLSSLLTANGGDGSRGFVLRGINAGDESGTVVSGAGDINGDGYADLMVSAPRAGSSDQGHGYVLFGKAGGFDPEFRLAGLFPANGGDGSQGFVLFGAMPGDPRGIAAVSGAGDINGDGFDDLIIGAPNVESSYVVFGRQNGFGATFKLSSLLAANGGDGGQGFALHGAYGNAGRSVSSAGDLNGDGFDELLVGVPGAGAYGENGGAAYVVFGKAGEFAAEFDLSSLEVANGGDGTQGFVLLSQNFAEGVGTSVARAGDINGDGFDDLIVGSGHGDERGNTRDRGYVIYGKAGSFAAEFELPSLSAADGGDGSDGFLLYRVDTDDECGLSVSGVGDINGDGFDDLIAGACGAEIDQAHEGQGESYVIFGGNFSGAVALPGTAADDTLTGTAASESLNGGGGDDTLDGGDGNDVLIGGEGNDILYYDPLDTLRVDGGLGIDTLRVRNGDGIDFTALPNNRITGIERINLELDAAANTIILDVLDALDIADANTLYIFGKVNDVVDIGPGMTDSGASATLGGRSYRIYSAPGTDLRLYIEQELSVI